MSEPRGFADGRTATTVRPALPIDQYLAELDALVAAHDYFAQDRVTAAIGSGRASPSSTTTSGSG